MWLVGESVGADPVPRRRRACAVVRVAVARLDERVRFRLRGGAERSSRAATCAALSSNSMPPGPRRGERRLGRGGVHAAGPNGGTGTRDLHVDHEELDVNVQRTSKIARIVSRQGGTICRGGGQLLRSRSDRQRHRVPRARRAGCATTTDGVRRGRPRRHPVRGRLCAGLLVRRPCRHSQPRCRPLPWRWHKLIPSITPFTI